MLSRWDILGRRGLLMLLLAALLLPLSLPHTPTPIPAR